MDRVETSDLGIEIDGENGRIRVEDGSVSFSQIRHIIVNKDASEGDMIAGAVVIQTMPGKTNLLAAPSAPNNYEFIVRGDNDEDVQRKVEALESLSHDLERCTAGYGIGVTTTNVPQDLFHRTFAEID